MSDRYERARAIAEAAANRWDAFGDTAGINWLADTIKRMTSAPEPTPLDEREQAKAEVIARLKNHSLGPCLDCGGQGYTDMGKSACYWCRGAGVITQEMAYAFGVADRAEAASAMEARRAGTQGGPVHDSAVGAAETPTPTPEA